MADNLSVGIFGAGGHAKVIFDMLQLRQFSVQSIFDDNPAIKALCEIEVTHTFEKQFTNYPWIIAVGSNKIRKKIASIYNLEYLTIIHPWTMLDHTIYLGTGTVVTAGAIINASTLIGDHVIINTGAIVEHDCNIASFSHVAPKATLCGGVSVGEGTLIGAGSIAIPGIKIGKWCIIGAGTTVIKDIPDFSVVVGNPGRIIQSNNAD